MSTAPPAAYGTKICTGFDGNGDCADAPTHSVNMATAAAAIRNHQPIPSSPDTLSCYLVISYLVISHGRRPGSAAGRRLPIRSGHVDNPVDRVKLRRIRRDHGANEGSSRNKGESDGGCRGTNVVPRLARKELAWDRAGRPQTQ